MRTRIAGVQETMDHTAKTARTMPPAFLALALSLILAVPTVAYDFPLTSSAIRDAYFLGTRQGSLGTEFLSEYRHTIPGLRVAEFISFARIETPFVQVAVQSSRKLNYSVQDAVQEFRGKMLAFHIHMEICYMPDAPPDALQIKLVQNKREIIPNSVERSAFFRPTDPYTRLPSIGETMDMNLDSAKIDSSTLTIVIDTPDGRRAQTEFDLRSLR